jgi:hypothetical protein
MYLHYTDCTHTTIGQEYLGTKAHTITGRSCQKWDLQYPHVHGMTDPNDFPDVSLEHANNYCRNPDRRPGTGPWCFTANPDILWEPCGIPLCLGI